MMNGDKKRDRDDRDDKAEAEAAAAGPDREPEPGEDIGEDIDAGQDFDAGPGEDFGLESSVVEDEGIPGYDDPSQDDDAARIAELEAEATALRDKVLRQAAETENVRRRLQRDKDDAVRYAALPLIRDLLGAVDNLERALDSLPEGATAEDSALSNLVAGLELTRKELATVFERHRVTPIQAQGAQLDANRHEAMFEVQDPSVPSGTVVQVLQSGYMMHDRLVRPARVGVAKGGPPPGSGAANDDAPQPGTHIDTEA